MAHIHLYAASACAEAVGPGLGGWVVDRGCGNSGLERTAYRVPRIP